MTDERDFAIDAEDLEPAAERPEEMPAPAAPADQPAPATAPKVVIQYRNWDVHRALLPPLLVVIAALLITSYQRQEGLRPIARTVAPRKSADAASPASPGRIIMVEPAPTGAAVEPINVRPVSPPEPAPSSPPEPAPVAADPPPSEAVSVAATPSEPVPAAAPAFALPVASDPPPAPLERTPPAAPPLEPPMPLRSAWAEPLSPDSPELAFRVAAAAPAGAAPGTTIVEFKLTKAQILEAIQAEAEQKKAEQRNLEQEIAVSKRREAIELLERTQAERTKFHDDLRRVLQASGDAAGPEIKELCDRYGRDMPADAQRVMTLALKRAAAGAKREFKFDLMRWYGAPEPILLDLLANELDQMRKTRGGPRNQDQVRVLAAKFLLRYPPPKGPVARTQGNAQPRPARPAQ